MEKQTYDFIRDMQFKHWWFKGRARTIEIFLRRYFLTCKNKKILDIGSGFGGLVPVLKKFGRVDALEPYTDAYNKLKKNKKMKVYNLHFPEQYPTTTYDLISMFDVLEHLKSDMKSLKLIRKKLLNKNGKIILSVPAHMWLWSNHDLIHSHYRRYSKKELTSLLKKAGFKNIRISYYLTLLFPLAIGEKMIEKFFHIDNSMKKPSLIINSFFDLIYFLENQILKIFNLPYGLSLIVIADK